MTDRKTAGVAIREVTLLEDRALVRRRGVVALEAGRNRLQIDDVAPVLVDKTLLGEVATDVARVVDLRAVRTTLHLDELLPDDLRALDDEIVQAKRAVAALDERVRASQSDAGAVTQLIAALVSELSVDAAWARPVTDAREASFKKLVDRERAARQLVVTTQLELEKARAAMARKVARRAAAERPSSKRAARLELDIEATEACEAEVTLSYVVPNACWRPRHRAVLSDEDRSVTFATEGVIWQNTGETWESVDVALSTERPSLGAEPPRLADDPLGVVRKGALVIETRQEEIEQTGLGGGEKKASEDLPGIDDGGEALSLRGAHPVTIRSDGRPHSVPISSFTAKTEVRMVATPELVHAAMTKTTFENASGKPLLAGPVELVRHGGHVGKTTISFIAAGEKLGLGWGPDGAVRVHREVEALKDESSMLSSWVTKTNDVRVRISNLGPYAKSIVVTERVPVSEIEKVQISTVPKETTGEKEPDSNGFITWNVELAPFGRQLLKLRVVTRRHSDVVG